MEFSAGAAGSLHSAGATATAAAASANAAASASLRAGVVCALKMEPKWLRFGVFSFWGGERFANLDRSIVVGGLSGSTVAYQQ